MHDMEDRENLRAWMRRVLAEKGWTAKDWAGRANTSPSNITRFLKSGDAHMPTMRTLTKLSAAAGTSPVVFKEEAATRAGESLQVVTKKRQTSGDVDLRQVVKGPIVEGPGDLPIYTSADNGPGEMLITFEPIEYVGRPEPLKGVPQAYGFYCVGNSMSPRYERGDLVLVHPGRPPIKGDDVLVIKVAESTNEHIALVKRFERETPETLFLRQLNPKKIIKISRQEVHSINLIIGRYNRPK